MYSLIVSCVPQAALVYDGDIIFKYGDNFKNVEISRFIGIGKYPYLVVSAGGTPSTSTNFQTVVDFGTVAIGKTVEKWIDLQNLTPVSNIKN